MLWEVTTPPVNPLLTVSQLAYHLRVDAEIAATADEQDYLNDMLAAAVEYAETAMQTSLLTRTITATYFTGEELELPRGPAIAVVSVTGPTGNPVTGSTLQRTGNTDCLILPGGFTGPMVVVYTAGYGADSSDVPADVRQAIRVHVGSMYENRESVTDRPANTVPHSLDAFYGRKCRQAEVG